MPRKRVEIPQMRGVEDLISMSVEQPTVTVPINQICLPQKQPRRYFDPEKMAQLAQSIQEFGILEPLLVRPIGQNQYELIAGERRYRAAKEIGLKEVPVVSKELDDKQSLQIALMENLQREDLNPIEETEAMLELLALTLETNTDEITSLLYLADNAKRRGQELTQNVLRQLKTIEQTLSTVGKFTAASFRASRLPLLKLPNDVLEALRQGKLEYTKAQAIARIKDEQQRSNLLEAAIAQTLSLNEIKTKIQEVKPAIAATPEKAFVERLSGITKQLRKNKTWGDRKKQERITKLLDELEKLTSDPNLTS